MVNTHKNQSGNVHTVITIIVSVVILGALGFVFWSNFVKSDSDPLVESEVATTTTPTSTNTSSEEPAASVDELVAKDLMSNDNLGIKYKMPSSWSGGKYGGGDSLSDSESTTLTAPDGFSISLSISRLVRGWTNEDPTAKILEIQPNAKAGLNWVVVDRYNTANSNISLQIVNSKETAYKVGDEKVTGSSIYKLGEAEGSGVYLEMYGGYVTNMSLADFNAKESVKQAKAIFESVSIGL